MGIGGLRLKPRRGFTPDDQYGDGWSGQRKKRRAWCPLEVLWGLVILAVFTMLIAGWMAIMRSIIVSNIPKEDILSSPSPPPPPAVSL